jgi:hypothetical protein
LAWRRAALWISATIGMATAAASLDLDTDEEEPPRSGAPIDQLTVLLRR